MATATAQSERRRATRERKIPAQSGTLWFETAAADWDKTPAEIVNSGVEGLSVRVKERLQAGQAVLVEAPDLVSNSGGRLKAHVIWCRQLSDGRHQAGLAFDGAGFATGAPGVVFEDHYETLEVNPTASFDTIHKVYRMLAQRLHPDNPESGNDESFKRLVKAYQVLSEPESRAAFDVARNQNQGGQFQLFDAASATPGLESELKKRAGILALLYGRRMRTPERPNVSLHEMEKLLGVPREHLEFPLWYLREQGWIAKGDNAQFAITAKGVERAESTGAWQPSAVRSSRLIAAASA